MLKRIFAVVDEKDFFAFQHRANNEGLNMGQAFSSLVYAYANNLPIDVATHKDYIYELYKQENMKEGVQK